MQAGGNCRYSDGVPVKELPGTSGSQQLFNQLECVEQIAGTIRRGKSVGLCQPVGRGRRNLRNSGWRYSTETRWNGSEWYSEREVETRSTDRERGASNRLHRRKANGIDWQDLPQDHLGRFRPILPMSCAVRWFGSFRRSDSSSGSRRAGLSRSRARAPASHFPGGPAGKSRGAVPEPESRRTPPAAGRAG